MPYSDLNLSFSRNYSKSATKIDIETPIFEDFYLVGVKNQPSTPCGQKVIQMFLV